jgi:hypothetical protein
VPVLDVSGIARRLAAEILQAIEAGVFHSNPGWQCKDCQFRSQRWAWR